MAAFKGHEVAPIAGGPKRFEPAYGGPEQAGITVGREPTLARGDKVYFWWVGRDGTDVLIECDVSPGAKTTVDGDVERLTEGHVRVLCPQCGHGLHVSADNKVVYLSRKRRIEYDGPDGARWILPSLTIMEPVYCDYREETAGACRWAAQIAEGRGYPAERTLFGKGTAVALP